LPENKILFHTVSSELDFRPDQIYFISKPRKSTRNNIE
jgi:hypothetical protein